MQLRPYSLVVQDSNTSCFDPCIEYPGIYHIDTMRNGKVLQERLARTFDVALEVVKNINKYCCSDVYVILSWSRSNNDPRNVFGESNKFFVARFGALSNKIDDKTYLPIKY